MHVWRLTRQKYTRDALKGIGTRLIGGRWNSIGTAVGYTTGSLELAVLEALVQLDITELGLDYCWVQFEVPDDAIETLSTLPPQWDLPRPYRSGVQAVGDMWVQSQRSLALCVPAAVLPERQNILVNPAHPRFIEIREMESAPFTWPKRLADYLHSLRIRT